MPLIPETWLAQQTVNTTTTGSQTQPDIIQLANGNILVAWTSTATTGVANPAGEDIVAQIYDPMGAAVGGEFRLNTSSTADNEQHVDLAALPNGGFVAAYFDQDIDVLGGANIRIERYSAAGVSNGSALVVLDSGSAVDPDYRNPHIAVGSATSALVIYEEVTGGVAVIRGKLYDPTANTLGPVISLIASPGGDFDADVTALTNGNFVITATNNEVGGDARILYRVVNSAGANVLGVTSVSGTDSDGFADNQSSVTALPNGNFIISWTGVDASDTDVQWRMYNSVGTQIDSGNVAAGGATNNNNESDILALEDGTFVVVYDNDATGQVQVERFNAAGTSLGIFTIAAAAGTQISSTSLEDGRFAVTWVIQGGELAMEILDTRDNANPDPVYTGDWQIGTVGNDTFTHDGTSNIVHGHSGQDVITAGNFGPAVQVFGDDGNDTIIVQSGLTDDLYNGGNGTDTIDWSGSGVVGGTFDLTADLASAGGASEVMTLFQNIIGTPNADILIGDGGINILTGGGGNDTITGGGGADELFGGTGNDTYVNALSSELNELANQGFDAVLTDTSFSLVTVANVERAELTGATPSFLRGNGFGNQLVGNSGSNPIEGFAGDDIIFAVGGRDVITGGLGRDDIHPGLERDTLVFTSVAESTGADCDIVFDWIFSIGGAAYESFDFNVAVSGIRATVVGGTLNDASFDANMEAAITATQLSSGQAVLWDPSAGDRALAGRVFLIVDANAIGGYQAGQDYVVELDNPFGALNLGEFI